MIETADAPILITSSDLVNSAPDSVDVLVLMDEDLADMLVHSHHRFPNPDDSHLAYIMYTSGSTGSPKPVGVEQKSVNNLALQLSQVWDITPQDRILQFAALIWDTSLEEMLPSLWVGSTLIIPRQSSRSDVGQLLRDCVETGVTVADLPTAFWNEFAYQVTRAIDDVHLPEGLRLVIIGGERARPELVKSWLALQPQGPRLFNSYGCTEAAAITTLYEVRGGDADLEGDVVPIGFPMRGVQVAIVDPEMNPVPSGSAGEIVVGGVGIARGYLTEPDSDRFVMAPEMGGRIYRTGDSARELESGNLEYLGRQDTQLKVRGVRVRLDEVEDALLGITGVRTAAAIEFEDEVGTALAVFVVVGSGCLLDSAAVKGGLGSVLPREVVPHRVEFVEALPLTPSGKIDRVALRGKLGRKRNIYHPDVRSEIARKLVDLWAGFLDVESIGPDDSFVSLGGDSLATARMLFETQRMFEIAFAPSREPERMTLGEMVAWISEGGHGGRQPPE